MKYSRKAFTLIELLVVIAIIAILAAILFPVFAQAKAAAKQTSTLSGLKQMALGLQMYSNDFDDMTVPYYGYSDGSIPGDTNLYHYNTTWAGRIYPYVKNQSIFFDKDFGEINNFNQFYQDPYYSSDTYAWSWITTFSINSDGYSEQTWNGSSCTDYGSEEQTDVVRSQTAISSPAARMVVTPTRYGSIPNFSWMYFVSWEASFPVADVYATTYDTNQIVYDARKQYTSKFEGAYADGHAGKYGSEKFVKEYVNTPSQSQATGYSGWCTIMNANNGALIDFWGPYWAGN